MKFTTHEDLNAYKAAFSAAMEIFNLSMDFPKVERYSLTNQVRRSSRSVCANIAEAFYRRKYPKSFSLRISDAIAEAAETRVWLNFSCRCNYMSPDSYKNLDDTYKKIIGMLITMINQPDKWSL